MNSRGVILILLLVVLIDLCDGKGGGRGGGGRISVSRGSSSGGKIGGKSGSHYGAPPAYPGLAHRPVPNLHHPPAYSPRVYGSTFGSTGLKSNTYINNNYYGGTHSTGSSPFLTYALFYGAVGHHGGGHYGTRNSRNRPWNDTDDQQWRETTKAPYFENKIPGSNSYLPAAAVVGAATAFGLASLLPLNVPANKPLMLCNTTEIAQSPIKIDNNIYSCDNNSITVLCLIDYEEMSMNATTDDSCSNRTLLCDDSEVNGDIYCANEIMLSKTSIVCNSTTIHNTKNDNETEMILNCYFGELPEDMASFIPTTAAPEVEKELSVGAKVHVFLLYLIGKGHIIENRPTTTTPVPTERSWLPEALTIPPDTTPEPSTTTTETPFMLMMKNPIKLHKNGTFDYRDEKLDPYLEEMLVNSNEPLPSYIFKAPITTEHPGIQKDLGSEKEQESVSEEDDDDYFE